MFAENSDMAAIGILNQSDDLLCEDGSAVYHRQQDAADSQGGVNLPANLRDGFEQ